MRSAFVAVVIALTVALGASPAHADPPVALPLVIHIPGAAADDYARTLLTAAAEAYAPTGICFVPTFVELPEASRTLRTIGARRALRRQLVAGAINVFLVDHALDPNPSASTLRAAERVGRTLTGRLGGAHIPAAGARPGTYVIVTRDAQRFTLAHELGHVLGEAHHRDPTNIMSYGAERNTFDARQARTFLARARRFISRRDVRRLAPTECPHVDGVASAPPEH